MFTTSDSKLRSVSHSFRFFIHFLPSIFKTNFIFRKKYSSSSQSRTVRWKGAITCWKRAITSDKIRIEKYTLYFWKAEKNLHRMRLKNGFRGLKKIGKITGKWAITGHAWVKSRCPVIQSRLHSWDTPSWDSFVLILQKNEKINISKLNVQKVPWLTNLSYTHDFRNKRIIKL